MSAVFVVGSLHLDVIVNAPSLPRPDETLIGSAVAYAFGGKGGNQALAAARMGAKTAMAGRVGADRFGQQLLTELDRAGIDRTQVATDSGASGMSVAIVDPAGDYGAVVVSAANTRINAAAITIPPGTRVLCLQNEIPAAVNIAIAGQAKARGLQTLLNAAPALASPYASPDLFPHLIVNRIEAADMTGSDDPMTAARQLSAQGYATVILTLGSDGLLLCTTAEPVPYPAPKVTAISSHGAGDAFVGACAAMLAQGAALTAALDFAQSAAALHVATPPEQRATITPGQVRDFSAAQSTSR